MLELLTGGAPKASFNPIPILGYNFDQDKSTSGPGVTVVNGGVVQTLGVGGELAGYTKARRWLNATGTINSLPDVETIGLQDFTFEGWFWWSSVPANYQTVFQIRYPGYDIYVGFGDQGFGYRLQTSVNARGGVQFNYATPQTRTSVVSKWHHVAMVRKDKKIRFYFDGVQQALASGTSFDYAYQEYDGNFSLVGTPSILNLSGAYVSGGDTFCPEFALFIGAKYTKNFTPPVGPIVK